MTDDPYCQSSGVLKNKLGIADPNELQHMERLHVRRRLQEGTPLGDFDLAHLCAIHKHLFQDVYDWAGEVRRAEITKGGHTFQFYQYIETGMADVHRRLVQSNFLRGIDADSFSRKAAEIIGDVNYVHPFREGNGRAQLEYLRQLAHQAGHNLSQDRLDPANWIKASKLAYAGNYELMGRTIRSAIQPERELKTVHPEELTLLLKDACEKGDLDRIVTVERQCLERDIAAAADPAVAGKLRDALAGLEKAGQEIVLLKDATAYRAAHPDARMPKDPAREFFAGHAASLLNRSRAGFDEGERRLLDLRKSNMRTADRLYEARQREALGIKPPAKDRGLGLDL